MTFEVAFDKCKHNAKIARASWPDKMQYIQLATNISYMNSDGKIINSDHAAIGNKALVLVNSSGSQVGWLPSQADLLAGDWITI